MPKHRSSSKSQNHPPALTSKPRQYNKYTNFLHLLFCKVKNFIPSNNVQEVTQENSLVNNFLKFNEKVVEDVMIPRSSIIALPHTASIENLSEVINKLSHTRIFIYQDSLDNVLGFVHIKDIFKIITKKQNFNLSRIIRKPIISTPPMKLLDLFKEMQQKRTHISIVVDEYGATDGMITIENILEEIFGEIDDEHDNIIGDKNYKIINPSTLLTSNITSVEVLENLLKVKLKKENDEFETIGGLVLAKVGSVPLKGTKIQISDEVELEVVDSSPRALKKIKIILKTKIMK